ncbi:MAG: hypothetical protein HONBIEJF_01963 [Fimbriimonadaceae bacterium]|nr:hypothetical protein [Fimbriimonadaceae bacterium]
MRAKLSRMLRRLAVAVSAFAAIQACQAQGAISITFPDNANRQAWVSAGEFDVPGQNMVSGSTGSVSVGDGSTLDTHYVHVWDVDRNALATRKVAVARKGWKVTDADYTHHYSVRVRCESQGKPVAAATVDLTAGNVTQSKLLSPDRQGVATFYAVKAGKMTLQARYNVGEESKVSPAVSYVLGPFDPAARAPLVIALTDAVATVDPAAATTDPGAKKAEPPAPASPPPSTGGNILLYIVGLGLAGMLIYGILVYTRKNADMLNAKLEKVGVQIPADPADDPEPDIVPAGPMPTPQPAQIILGEAPADTPAAAAVSPVANPRLVRDGTPWLVPDGATTIGREGAAELALATESTVSRRHAEISRTGDAVTVTDLGSTNGTFVNGQRLNGAQELRAGDTVQFGAIQFRFET